MLRDVIYHGITPDFWNRCDGVPDGNHRDRFGFITCGMGQPGQAEWMTYPASHARLWNIQVFQE
jgi:TldD protein